MCVVNLAYEIPLLPVPFFQNTCNMDLHWPTDVEKPWACTGLGCESILTYDYREGEDKLCPDFNDAVASIESPPEYNDLQRRLDINCQMCFHNPVMREIIDSYSKGKRPHDEFLSIGYVCEQFKDWAGFPEHSFGDDWHDTAGIASPPFRERLYYPPIAYRVPALLVHDPNRRNTTVARLADYSNAKAIILYGTEQPLSKQIITDYIHLADPDAYYNMLDQKWDPTQSSLLSCPCSIYVRTSASVITNVNRQTLRVSESIPYREWKSIEVQRDRIETHYYAVDGQTGKATKH
ncbi:MAG: hypothetical protein Q9180_009177, partial [Flavoplaca navasiana]